MLELQAEYGGNALPSFFAPGRSLGSLKATPLASSDVGQTEVLPLGYMLRGESNVQFYLRARVFEIWNPVNLQGIWGSLTCS